MYLIADRNKTTYAVLNATLAAVKAVIVLDVPAVHYGQGLQKDRDYFAFSPLYPIVIVKLISCAVSFVLLFDI
jgi:hypothetical protein